MKILKTFLLLIFITFSNANDFKIRIIKSIHSGKSNIATSIQVYDNNYEPIIGLANSNFELKLDGYPIDSLTVNTYEEKDKGINIVLCIDISGTMKGEPIKIVKNAINSFVEELREIDKLSIFGFADDAELIVDFTNDKDLLRKEIDKIKVKGTQSALYYSVYKGLQKLVSQKDDYSKILMVMSDGKNESLSQSYNEDDIIALAQNEKIPIFSIGYSKIDKSYLRSLERLSDKTHGNYYESPTNKELESQFQKLYRQLLNIYVLEYKVKKVNESVIDHNLFITVKKDDIQKSSFSAVTIPIDLPMGDEDNNYYLIFSIAGAGLVSICLIMILLIIKNSKKKKQKELEQRERKILNEIEEEKSKREELERKIDSISSSKEEIVSEVLESESGKNTSKDQEQITNTSDPERTIILRDAGSNTKTISLKLQILVGKDKGKVFNVYGKGAYIGRSLDNDIVINEQTISKKHAQIYLKDGVFRIVDLDSTSGVYINGNKINEINLSDEDVFKFGLCEGRIKISI